MSVCDIVEKLNNGRYDVIWKNLGEGLDHRLLKNIIWENMSRIGEGTVTSFSDIKENIVPVCCSKASDIEVNLFSFTFQPSEKTNAWPVASPVDSSSLSLKCL